MAELTTVRVGLVLEADTDDAEEMDELTRRLRGEISQLDVSEVSSVEREAPAGTKAGPVAEVGAFLVTLVQTAGGMRAVIGTAQAWLSHHPDRTVEMEVDGDRIKVTGASSETQDRLIDAWIERRAASDGTG